MTIYVRGENPIWFFNNLTGQVLDDTYWAFFLTNDLPYIPQAVYQDPNGISPWANPLEFQPSGGLPNNLYFNPDLVYRIEIRQGPNQTDPLIWLIENYVPSNTGGGGSVVADQLTVAANLITDPNFSDVDFVTTYTYTQGSPGTYTLDIAPGWQLVLTGAGTTVLTQGTFAGNSNTQGNPPYYLGINNSGWTTAVLKQTLTNNGAIFANGAIALAFTAQSVTTGETVTVNYVPNGTANSQTIFSGTVTTGGFMEYYGAINVDPSLNTNTGTDADVEIQFVLPGTGNVQLTNIQVVGQSVPLSAQFVLPGGNVPGSVPLYQELTYEQIVNGEFNVYRDSILNQPKDSFLVGWNFALNPWQFTTKTVTNVAANQYTADQTIVIQQNYVASATGNNIAVGQAPETNNLGFEAKAVTAHNQFGILQYIPASTNTPYFGDTISSMVRAQLLSTHVPTTTVRIKMRLLYLNNTPSATSQSYPVASWTEGGDPVFAAGVTAVIPPNDPVYTLSTDDEYYAFNNIGLPDLVATPQTLGIFLYTIDNMNQAATADAIVVHDVSLVRNRYALPTQPQTTDEVLRQCQFFYEKSYYPDVLPGTATQDNMITAPQNTWAGANLYVTSIELQYKQTKTKEPTMTFYAQDGTINTVKLIIFKDGTGAVASGGSPNTNPFNAPIGDWAVDPDIDRALMVSQSTTNVQITATTTLNEGFAQFHYTADSRYG